MPGLAATAVDWGDAVDLGDGLEVHVEPTLHWSARGTGDRMHALWASFVVRAGARKVYCVGDSGFGDGATSPASASAIQASRWRYCRSAPTSRAGSCATST